MYDLDRPLYLSMNFCKFIFHLWYTIRLWSTIGDVNHLNFLYIAFTKFMLLAIVRWAVNMIFILPKKFSSLLLIPLCSYCRLFASLGAATATGVREALLIQLFLWSPQKIWFGKLLCLVLVVGLVNSIQMQHFFLFFF